MAAKIAFLFLAGCAIVYSAPADLEGAGDLPKQALEQGQKGAAEAVKQGQEFFGGFGSSISDGIKGGIEQGQKLVQQGIKSGQDAFQTGRGAFTDAASSFSDNIKDGFQSGQLAIGSGIKTGQDAFQKGQQALTDAGKQGVEFFSNGLGAFTNIFGKKDDAKDKQ